MCSGASPASGAPLRTATPACSACGAGAGSAAQPLRGRAGGTRCRAGGQLLVSTWLLASTRGHLLVRYSATCLSGRLLACALPSAAQPSGHNQPSGPARGFRGPWPRPPGSGGGSAGTMHVHASSAVRKPGFLGGAPVPARDPHTGGCKLLPAAGAGPRAEPAGASVKGIEVNEASSRPSSSAARTCCTKADSSAAPGAKPAAWSRPAAPGPVAPAQFRVPRVAQAG
jgi:hypothetical protein